MVVFFGGEFVPEILQQLIIGKDLRKMGIDIGAGVFDLQAESEKDQGSRPDRFDIVDFVAQDFPSIELFILFKSGPIRPVPEILW